MSLPLEHLGLIDQIAYGLSLCESGPDAQTWIIMTKKTFDPNWSIHLGTYVEEVQQSHLSAVTFANFLASFVVTTYGRHFIVNF